MATGHATPELFLVAIKKIFHPLFHHPTWRISGSCDKIQSRQVFLSVRAGKCSTQWPHKPHLEFTWNSCTVWKSSYQRNRKADAIEKTVLQMSNPLLDPCHALTSGTLHGARGAALSSLLTGWLSSQGATGADLQTGCPALKGQGGCSRVPAWLTGLLLSLLIVSKAAPGLPLSSWKR